MLYRDLFYKDETGKAQLWQRISIQDIPGAISSIEKAGHQGLYLTIQTFQSPKHQDGEPYDADFVIDLDSEDPADALDDCRKVVNFMTDTLGIQPGVFFSGCKGFHIIVPRQVLGAMTAPDLNKRYKALAWKLKKDLNLTTIDLVIYSSRRMLRVPNTKHGKSGLYKIPLAVNELALPVERIKELATNRRDILKQSEPKRNEKAAKYYDLASSFLEQEFPEPYEPQDVQFDNTPPCINAILENGVFELHTVNATMFRLVAYFKSQGITNINTLDIIKEWLRNIKPQYCMDLTPDGLVDLKALEVQAKSVIRSVYNNANYSFSCAGMKSVIGDRFCTEACRKLTEERIVVDLFNASKAEYLGRRIHTVAEAIGRNDDPIAIPLEIRVRCEPTNNDRCQRCPLIGSFGNLTLTISARTPNVIDWIEFSTAHMGSRICHSLPGLPNNQQCKQWSFEIIHNQNIEAIYIAPPISNEFEETARYIREKIYYFGHGLEPNQSYEFSGFSHIARNNVIRFCFDEASPLQDNLVSFEQTPEMLEATKVFQPYMGQEMILRHNQIIESIAYNYIHVWGRSNLLKAVDIVYHSVRKFYFQRNLINGWCDILILGDTGQGKSWVIKQFMKHYGLGFRSVGESANRPGLLYTIPINEKDARYIIWGLIPRYSGRLVVIDECQPLIQSGEIGLFTDARDGEVTVSKSAWGVAASETRLIWITNTVDGKPLKTYGYPVLAISDLIKGGQDIRRFTFAILVASNDVDDTVINQDIEVMQPIADYFKTDICRNHLLWIWNLKPDDIVIGRKIEQRILALSVYMCSQYSASIPLVEPGDFRFKLARVALAIAARMNCRMGDKLVVTDEAVDYAYSFLNELYHGENMKYYQYSAAYAEYVLTSNDLERLTKTFQNQWSMWWQVLGKQLLLNPEIRSKELAVHLGMDEKELKTILTWMSGNKLLRSERTYYSKTVIGIKFLENLVPESKVQEIKSAEEVINEAEFEEE